MSNNNTKSENIVEKRNEHDKRSREWIFILYPESAPNDWKNQLRELHINYVISPLHDKDKNEDGTLKKPHFHILLSFNNQKSFSQIREITDLLNQPIPQICHNKTGQIRYFIHIDNPEKYQYSKDDIETYGQVDLDLYFKQSKTEGKKIEKEIIRYCINNNIDEYCDLVTYCLENNDTWYDYISDHTIHISKFLSSCHFKKKETIQKLRDENIDLAVDRIMQWEDERIKNLASESLENK